MVDFEGVAISEEETAKELGFKDIFELRQWRTKTYQEKVKVEQELKCSQQVITDFKYHLDRCLKALEIIKE